jgi:hypothetical protein
MSALKYLAGYPPDLLARVEKMIEQGRLAESLAGRYPQAHTVRTDRALYDYVGALRSEYMRNADSLDKVLFDGRLHVIRNALGTHTTVWRVQGSRLKVKREIRIANLFKDAPAAFLKMIVVHELAHLKHREHDKAFYALCEHMEPAYHQLEFDFRVYLTLKELPPRAVSGEGEGDGEGDGEGEGEGA